MYVSLYILVYVFPDLLHSSAALACRFYRLVRGVDSHGLCPVSSLVIVQLYIYIQVYSLTHACVCIAENSLWSFSLVCSDCCQSSSLGVILAFYFFEPCIWLGKIGIHVCVVCLFQSKEWERLCQNIIKKSSTLASSRWQDDESDVVWKEKSLCMWKMKRERNKERLGILFFSFLFLEIES